MRLVITLIILAVGVTAYGGEVVDNPIEVGDVRWGRDFDAALESSAKTGKPVLVLFQEIPGCEGVRKFGLEVLTNPLLVKAIESEFVPMLVYNNRKGGMEGGAKIGQRYSAFDRWSLGLASNAHYTGDRLYGEIEASLLGARAVLAVGRNRAIDQIWCFLFERLVVEPELGHRTRSKIFQYNIC